MTMNVCPPLLSFQDADLQQAWVHAFAANTPVYNLSPSGHPPVLVVNRRVRLSRRLLTPTSPDVPSYQLPGRPTADWLEALLTAAYRRYRFDVLQFDLVPEASDTCAAFAHLKADGWPIEICPWQISPVVGLDGGVEAFERQLSAKMRHNLNNARRRLERLGAVRFSEVGRADDWATRLDDAFRIESLGWKGQSGTAIGMTPHVREFYDWALRRFQAAGQMKLFLLHLDERLIAFNLVVTIGSTAVDWKISYDPQFSAYSPGNLLQRHVIHALLADERLERLDLGYPMNEFKRRWATGSETRMRIRVFPNVGYGRFTYRIRSWLRAQRERYA